MKKYMRSSKLRKIVVHCLDWSDEVDIDGDIFDDVYMEAATRVIEKNKDTPNFSVSIVMKCYDKKDENIPDKHFVYNTFFVLINAAMYAKAELLRLNFLKIHKIDIQKQGLKGYEPDTKQPPGSSNPSNN